MTEEKKNFMGISREDVIEADDDCFPEFLWNPIFGVDEDDSYYKIATSGYGISTEVRRLRRRYVDYSEWEAAMDVYEEYMKVLAEKYGSIEIVLHSSNEGLIEEYVPSRPRLKPSKKNKQILRTGVAPPRKAFKKEKGSFEKMAEYYYPYDEDRSDQFKAASIDDEIPKWAKKGIWKASKQMEERERIHNAYNGGDTHNGSDMIAQLLEKINNGEFDKLHEKSSNTKTVFDELEELTDSRYIEPELESASLEETYGVKHRRGRLVRIEDEKTIEFVKTLYELGIDILGGSHKNDTHIRLAREDMGLSGDTRYMTKKELKKYNKKLKKEKKWVETAKSGKARNSILEHTFLGNRKPEFITDEDSGITLNFRDIMGKGGE